jgi:methyl-accepting chemotaxis protein
MAGKSKDQGSAKELKDTIESLGSPIEKILDAIGSMYQQADSLNNAFVQGRTRLDEMNDAVSKAAAGIIRLGGDIEDISNTMAGIAEGSRRNVLATEDQVSKLYAASEILGTSSASLVENFAEVGYETSQIGPNLEKSIEYVQSIGLNAKTVVKDVADNMELMNRFNFNDGVQGLTRMAAQASMLRFDMKQTLDFANKVIDPEGARRPVCINE